MDKYYLIKVQNQFLDCGTIVRYNKKVISTDPYVTNAPIHCTVSDDWIELSVMKMKYLRKMTQTERIEIQNSQLFERIQQLKPMDECYFTNKGRIQKCVIIQGKDIDNHFIVKPEDKTGRKISIMDIVSIVNIDYYICINKCKKVKEGTIIIDDDGNTMTYPDKVCVAVDIHKLKKISREEAQFLCKSPDQERVKMHEHRIWERVMKLKVNDRCCLKNKQSYQIIGIKPTEDTTEFTLQSTDGKVVQVDISEILFERTRDRRNDSMDGALEGPQLMDGHKYMKNRIGINSEFYKRKLNSSAVVSCRSSSITTSELTSDPFQCLPENAFSKTEGLKKSLNLAVSDHSTASCISKDNITQQAKTQHYESTLIDPDYVTTIESVNYNEWNKDMEVEFRLGESCSKYSGLLKWTGLINKMRSAVIHVSDLETKDPINNYVCSKEMCCKLHLPFCNNLVIVLMATVSQSQYNTEKEYLKMIFGYINKRDIGVDILMDIIANENRRVLVDIIKVWKYPIQLKRYPDLLPGFIREGKYDIIAMLLNNFVASDNDNIHLLTIAYHFLVKENYQYFIIASKKCQDPNVVMDNGETLLTSVLKNVEFSENDINKVIWTKIFDLNTVNKDDDSPLILACRRVLVTTVRVLFSNRADASYRNNLALNTVISIKDKNDKNTVQRATEILAILPNETKQDYIICKICMDREINTVFRCGHNSCNICSDMMKNCPVCKEIITGRRRMYLG